jgi:formylglycine-generating enzyme required for sulfatase activity
MLESLSDLAVPQVFNSPELLNAYNLLALAADHIAAARYRDASTALSAAEAVMAGRLADLREAERLARLRYGLAGGEDIAAGDPESPEKLRAEWEASVQERRSFALALDQTMVLVPGGSFVMGDQTGDGSRVELPAHRVAVPAFKIGRTLVTRGEYESCAAAGVCTPLAGSDRGDASLPAAGVTWVDAQTYAAWLRQRTGEPYRLPSEAEWEYAARAGVASAFPWGNAIGRNRANCAGCGSAWDRSGPSPVNAFAANAFGLHDVVGNLWQWTADCWYRDHSSAPDTATPRDEPLCPQRVLRGGSWDNDAWMARLSYRSGAAATLRQDINGFRIAKSVE